MGAIVFVFYVKGYLIKRKTNNQSKKSPAFSMSLYRSLTRVNIYLNINIYIYIYMPDIIIAVYTTNTIDSRNKIYLGNLIAEE